MKIALNGFGKMGRLVADVTRESGQELGPIFDSGTGDRPPLLSAEALSGVDVCIDFSVPEAVVDSVRTAAGAGVDMVVGTTGWTERIDEVRRAVEEAGTGLVHGANFSIGMNLLFRLAETAGELFAPFDAFDPYLEETHHKEKLDAPSGTALTFRDLLASSYGERRIPISSTRAGYIPGIHRVGFDAPDESVVLSHTARSRQGFARGALMAAEWVRGRRGVYEFRQIFERLGR